MRAPSSYNVNRQGVFLHLDDTTAYKRRVDSAMAPLMDRLGGLSPALAQSMRDANSGATLNASAGQGWQQLAGILFGRTWAPGDSARSTFRQPMPGAPNASMIQRHTTTYTGMVTCPAGSGATTCWQFDSRTELDMSAMRESVRRMLADRGMDDPAAADRVPIPETTMNSGMIVDAATGRPLQVTSMASTRMDAGTAMGISMSFSIRYHLVVHYRWRALD